TAWRYSSAVWCGLKTVRATTACAIQAMATRARTLRLETSTTFDFRVIGWASRCSGAAVFQDDCVDGPVSALLCGLECGTEAMIAVCSTEGTGCVAGP